MYIILAQQVNSSVTSLELDDNNLTHQSCKYVIDLLCENRNIDSLVSSKTCKYFNVKDNYLLMSILKQLYVDFNLN